MGNKGHISLLVHAICLSTLGSCSVETVNDGIDCDVDIRACYSSLHQEASSGNTQAQFEAFIYVYEHGNELGDFASEAVGFLAEAAGKGHTEAQYNIGYMLLTGTWVDKDREQALIWLQLAANKANPRAQFLVGTDYYKQFLESDDPTDQGQKLEGAIKWLRMSAESGYVGAKSFLGSILVADPEHKEYAIRMLRDAANAGDQRAKDELQQLVESETESWTEIEAEQIH